MTGNRIIALLILAGIALLAIAGCESQPYQPWQPGDSWWDRENQARAETTAEKTTGTLQIQSPAPGPEAEPAPRSAFLAEPAVRQADGEPMPPPMVFRKAEVPLASHANAAGKTSGDVLLIDSIRSAPAIQTPRNGMSMASVRQQYGDPISEGSGIGDPPITRWEYADFSVYFEYDLVLHSVVHRPKQN